MRRSALHDTVWGGLFILLALFLFWGSTQVAAGHTWYRYSNLTWPRMVLLIMSGFSLILIVRGLRTLANLSSARPQESSTEDAPNPAWVGRKLLVTGVFYTLYVLAVSWLGFMLSTVLMVVGNMRLLGERTGPRMLFVALGTALAFALLFGRLVGVDFPRGVSFLRQWSFFFY